MTHWIMALSLWGVAAHVDAQELDLSSLVKLSKQMRAKELAESLGRNNVGSTPTNSSFNAPPPPPPPPPPEPPVLKVVLGVNDSLQAEVTYDGQTHILSQGVHPDKGLGPWKNSHLFTEGVLLTTVPVDLQAAKEAVPELAEPLRRKPVCQWLKLTGQQCLFLVPAPALARADAAGTNKGAAFQDQVRSLISQTPAAPVSYAPPSLSAPANPSGPQQTAPASNESVPVRARVFPK